MNDVTIRVEGLSKRYRIGLREEADDTFVGVITQFARRPLANLRRLRGLTDFRQDGAAAEDIIWALRDVSFEVRRGEVLGIIGRNGAGKSTLLKILSRITEPTNGRAEVRGRLSSLLEVGTGFHQELTGRDNIFLNGSVLGMTRAEIIRKFDEIVDFSGVERFIDTPVKRYSSGMKVRLAFAVAAHLEPEILLVDEVLAVGDYDFQRKCLGRMEDMSQQEGRTVLLVSHNMASIMNLCSRAILLNDGRVEVEGHPSDVVQQYMEKTSADVAEVVWPDMASAPGNENVRMHSVRLLSESGQPISQADIQKDILLQLRFWNLREGAKLYSAIHLQDRIGTYVFMATNSPAFSTTVDPWWNQNHPVGLYESVCRIPGNLLNEGTYTVTAIVGADVKRTEVLVDRALSFPVLDTSPVFSERGKRVIGVVRPRLAWHTEFVGPVEGSGPRPPEDAAEAVGSEVERR